MMLKYKKKANKKRVNKKIKWKKSNNKKINRLKQNTKFYKIKMFNKNHNKFMNNEIYRKNNNLLGELSKLNFIANLQLFHKLFTALKQVQHNVN